MKYSLLAALILLPQVGAAQTTGSLQSLIAGSLEFINSVLIPFVLGIAFLVFVINAVRFFVIGGSNKEGKENAKSLAIYSVGAFVFILAFWGIVNLLSRGIGLAETPCIDGSTLESDYINSSAPCSSPRQRPRPSSFTPAPAPNPFQIGPQ